MKKKEKKEVVRLGQVFQEATAMSFSLVFFPVLFLLIGVFVDKKFDTLPLFTISGIVLGITAGILRAIALGKKIKIKNG